MFKQPVEFKTYSTANKILQIMIWNYALDTDKKMLIFRSIGTIIVIIQYKHSNQGSWVAQWIEPLTCDLGSGLDLMVMNSSLTSGSTLGVEPT